MEEDPYEITSTHSVEDIDNGKSFDYDTLTESGIDHFSKTQKSEEHVEPSAIEGSDLKESLEENRTPVIDFSIDSINNYPPNESLDPNESPDEFMKHLKKNSANTAINNLDPLKSLKYNETRWESMRGGKKRTRRKNKIGMKL